MKIYTHSQIPASHRSDRIKRICLTGLFIIVCALAELPAQQAPGFRISHGPYLQEVTTDGSSFIFTTSHPSFSGIELKKEGTDRSTLYYHTRYGLHDAYNTFHAIRVENLEPGTKYNYRIRTKQIADFQPYKVTFADSITSQWYTFCTIDPKRKGGSFFIASDIHNDSRKLEKLLTLCDYQTCDAFLYAGDIMSYMENEETPFQAFIDTSVSMFATSIPFEMVRGNHETRGKMARIYPTLFPKKDGKIYGSYCMGDVFMILIDCGEDKPDDTPVYAGLTDFDNYRSEQAKWLQQLVKSKEFKRAKHRIVVSHFPMVNLYPETLINHGVNDLRKKLLPILNASDISLMISGHTHEYAFHEENSAGNAFPVIVGSNQSATRLDIGQGKIGVKVVDLSGKVLLERSFK